MEKKSGFQKLTAISLTIMLLVLLFIAIYYYENQPPTILYPGEIRDYQGENLASIADVQENAIREHNSLTHQLTA